MLRRSHRKSRGGCFECKRRHVKCDEHRPICRLCVNSDRTCHYPVQVPETTILKDQSNSTPPSAREHVIQFDQHPSSIQTSSTATPSSSSTAHSPNSDDAPSPENVNLAHMDLLIHITRSSSMFNLGAGISSYHSSGLSLGLEVALAYPYLMHVLLAFSAQHLSCLYPIKSSHYLDLSVRLQTRAIELFNGSYDGVREDNCVAIVLFSSVLGHHVLASTLAYRASTPTRATAKKGGGEADRREVDGLVAQYVQCMDTHRGIHTIATSSWPALMASELGPILAESREFTSRTPVGRDCDGLIGRVENCEGMNGEEKEACRKAIGYLQVGFDATSHPAFHEHLNGEELEVEVEVEVEVEDETNKHHMIYTWTMLVPREVTGLLVKKQPEALAILAFYAVLLHRGRELWQVGGAGRHLFEVVDEYVGEECDGILDGARREVKGEQG